MAEHYSDIVIVGGGPGGAAAAISLLTYTGFSVTIVEKSALDQIRVGEHVSPAICDQLDYLNLKPTDFEPGTFSQSFGITSFWGSDQPYSRDSIFTSEESTYQLDREKFDLKLLEEVSERGGIVLPKTQCIEMVKRPDGWSLSLKHQKEGTIKVECRFLIDATGRQASISRRLGIASHRQDELMGVGAFLSHDGSQPMQKQQLIEATELGWWYGAVLSETITAIVLFSDAQLIADFHLHKQHNWTLQLQKSKRILPWVQQAGQLTMNDLWVRNAFSHILYGEQPDHYVAIGDAVCAFDPISSMGIGFAISSAFNAVRAVTRFLNAGKKDYLEQYMKDINRQYEHYLGLRGKFYRQEKRFSREKFWSVRSEAVPV